MSSFLLSKKGNVQKTLKDLEEVNKQIDALTNESIKLNKKLISK